MVDNIYKGAAATGTSAVVFRGSHSATVEIQEVALTVFTFMLMAIYKTLTTPTVKSLMLS